MTAPEEEEFVEALVIDGAVATGAKERHHATIVLNALRLGVPADLVLTYLPGCTASELLSAYAWLDEGVDAVNLAWDAVFRAAEGNNGAAVDQALALLGSQLPAVEATVRSRAHQSTSNYADLVVASKEIDAEIAALHVTSDHVESLLAFENELLEGTKGTELGLALYHPTGSCLWASDLYVPRRTGEVVPHLAARILDA